MGKTPAKKAAETLEKTKKATRSKSPSEVKPKAQTKPVETTAETKSIKPDKPDKAKKVADPVAVAEAPKKKCTIKSCARNYRAKGYCRVHYKKWRHGEYGRARYKVCHDIGCRKPMAKNRHGYCEDHYQTFYVKSAAPTAKEPEQPAKVAS